MKQHNGRTHSFTSAMQRLVKVGKQSDQTTSVWYVDYTLCGNKTRGILDYLAGQHKLVFLDISLMPKQRR